MVAVIANVALGVITNILNKKAPEYWEAIEKKIRDKFSKSLQNYLNNQIGYYSKMKTILTSNTPKDFKSMYYPLSLFSDQYIDEKVRVEKISKCSITNVFRYSNYVLIYGEAGSGKSSIVKHLFIGCIEKSEGIPILIEFRQLNGSNLSLKEFIFEQILNYKLKDSELDIDKFLDSGVFTFFFDGYDEINPNQQKRIISELESFIKRYNNSRYIITSRPYTQINQLPQFHNYEVQNLTDKDIEPFTKKQIKAIFGQQHAEELSKAVTNSVLNSSTNHAIKSFMRNPLLLSLYIFTFQRNASIPENKSAFYERVINLLFTEHDYITKIGYNRIKKTELTQGQFIDILSVFSFNTYFNSMYEWSAKEASSVLKKIRDKIQGLDFKDNDFIDDMKVSLSLWVEDGGRISFAHRSLQEYFTALYIKQLNDTNKYSRIAEKIYKGSGDRFENRAHINLFSLCEELDFVNYSKSFQLPLLEAVFNTIEDLQGDELIELFYTHYCLEKLIINIDPERDKVVSITPYEHRNPIFLTSIWESIGKVRISLYDIIFQLKNPLNLLREYKVIKNDGLGATFEASVEVLANSKFDRKFIKDHCSNSIPVLNQFKSELKDKINQINQEVLRLEKKQKLYDDLYDDLI